VLEVSVDQKTYLLEPTEEMLFIEEMVNELPYTEDIVDVQYSEELLEAYEQLPELVQIRAAADFIGASDNWIRDKARLLGLELYEPGEKINKLFSTYTKQTVLQIYDIFHSIPMQGTALSLNDLSIRTGLGKDTLARKLPMLGAIPSRRRSNYNNRAGFFYDEDAEELINRHIESFPFAPEGWSTATAVGRMLGMGEARAQRILEPFNDETRELRAANNTIAPHYPPHAIEYAHKQAKIEQEEIPFSDEMDIALGGLVKVMGKHRSWIVNRLPYVEVETVIKRNPVNSQPLPYLSPNPQQALEALPSNILSFDPDLFRGGVRQKRPRKVLAKKVIELSDESNVIVSQEAAEYTPKNVAQAEQKKGVRKRQSSTVPDRLAVEKILFTQLRDDEDDADPLAWQKDGLCAQTNPEAFFPDKGGSVREAKKVCLSCEVVARCLKYAIDNDERFGIWGGMSERQRHKLKSETAA